jgi:hypothetical protein
VNFKKWLILKESPDEVRLNSETLTWRAGITFSLFDKYFLHGKKGVSVIHEVIAKRIQEAQYAIEAASRKEISAEELDQIITSPSRINGQSFLESKGTISDLTIQQLMQTIKALDVKRETESNKKYTFVAYRLISVNNAPDVLLGRLWDEDKVISFWNNNKIIAKHIPTIINFLSNFGDPKQYLYEVQGLSRLLNYQEFSNKQFGNTEKPNIDLSVVHTMPPGDLKSQLQKMFGIRPGKSVDIRNKQLAYTSENINRKL